ncbi:MAG: Fe-S protein assembly co-chaperone HscB [Buchnera aphidicola (Kaburagia rhusicola ensigallis)]
MNYFQLFNISQEFKIDIKNLLLKFYELQEKYHPDAQYNNSTHKHKNYLNKSMHINKGYHILKDPLKRAEYLLFLNSYNFKKEQKNLSQNIFLNEQLKLYEKLDTIKKTKKKKAELHYLSNIIEHKKKHYLLELELMFNEKKWKLAGITLYKLLFYKKFENKLNELKYE